MPEVAQVSRGLPETLFVCVFPSHCWNHRYEGALQATKCYGYIKHLCTPGSLGIPPQEHKSPARSEQLQKEIQVNREAKPKLYCDRGQRTLLGIRADSSAHRLQDQAVFSFGFPPNQGLGRGLGYRQIVWTVIPGSRNEGLGGVRVGRRKSWHADVLSRSLLLARDV